MCSVRTTRSRRTLETPHRVGCCGPRRPRVGCSSSCQAIPQTSGLTIAVGNRISIRRGSHVSRSPSQACIHSVSQLTLWEASAGFRADSGATGHLPSLARAAPRALARNLEMTARISSLPTAMLGGGQAMAHLSQGGRTPPGYDQGVVRRRDIRAAAEHVLPHLSAARQLPGGRSRARERDRVQVQSHRRRPPRGRRDDDPGPQPHTQHPPRPSLPPPPPTPKPE